MSDDDRTLLPELLPDPSEVMRVGTPRERARARLETLMARASAAGAGVVMTGCTGFGVVDPLPMDSGFIEGCFEEPSVGGLARTTPEEDVEVVFTPGDPSTYDLVAVLVTANASEVSRVGGADEMVLVLTPTDPALPIIIEAEVACERMSGERTSFTFSIDPGALTSDWSVIGS